MKHTCAPEVCQAWNGRQYIHHPCRQQQAPGLYYLTIAQRYCEVLAVELGVLFGFIRADSLNVAYTFFAPTEPGDAGDCDLLEVHTLVGT